MSASDSEPDGALDGDLIDLIKTGTQAQAATAFEQLVARHSSRLFLELRQKGLTSDEQREIANEVWCRAWERIKRFQYRGVDIFPWLSKMANLVTLERFRHRYLGAPLEEGGELEEATALSSHEQAVIERLTREEFRQAVNDVSREAPADYRDIITARFSMELTNDEIEELYGWSKRKVYLTAFRAVAWLKKRMEARYGPSIRDWLS